MTSILGVYTVSKPANIALTTKEDLNLYYQKICGVQRRCRMVRIKCLTCQIEEIQDMIVRVTPNSIGAKEILAERKIKQEKELQFRDWETKVLRMSETFKS
jgi:hypothetical protein